MMMIIFLQLSTFGRCEYEKTCQLLISLFDQAAQSYQELVQNTSASTTDLTIQEGTTEIMQYMYCTSRKISVNPSCVTSSLSQWHYC